MGPTSWLDILGVTPLQAIRVQCELWLWKGAQLGNITDLQERQRRYWICIPKENGSSVNSLISLLLVLVTYESESCVATGWGYQRGYSGVNGVESLTEIYDFQKSTWLTSSMIQSSSSSSPLFSILCSNQQRIEALLDRTLYISLGSWPCRAHT